MVLIIHDFTPQYSLNWWVLQNFTHYIVVSASIGVHGPCWCIFPIKSSDQCSIYMYIYDTAPEGYHSHCWPTSVFKPWTRIVTHSLNSHSPLPHCVRHFSVSMVTASCRQAVFDQCNMQKHEVCTRRSRLDLLILAALWQHLKTSRSCRTVCSVLWCGPVLKPQFTVSVNLASMRLNGSTFWLSWTVF